MKRDDTVPPEIIEELGRRIVAIRPLAELLVSDVRSAEDRELLRAKARSEGVFLASPALNCLCGTPERAKEFAGKANEEGAMDGQRLTAPQLVKKVASLILAVRPLAEQFVLDEPRPAATRCSGGGSHLQPGCFGGGVAQPYLQCP